MKVFGINFLFICWKHQKNKNRRGNRNGSRSDENGLIAATDQYCSNRLRLIRVIAPSGWKEALNKPLMATMYPFWFSCIDLQKIPIEFRLKMKPQKQSEHFDSIKWIAKTIAMLWYMWSSMKVWVFWSWRYTIARECLGPWRWHWRRTQKSKISGKTI